MEVLRKDSLKIEFFVDKRCGGQEEMSMLLLGWVVILLICITDKRDGRCSGIRCSENAVALYTAPPGKVFAGFWLEGSMVLLLSSHIWFLSILMLQY